MCPGSAYGKASRKKLCNKGDTIIKYPRKAMRARDVASADQFISTVPGFSPIHWKKPTSKGYIGATVFVDHYTDLTYVHLMTVLTAESTVAAK